MRQRVVAAAHSGLIRRTGQTVPVTEAAPAPDSRDIPQGVRTSRIDPQPHVVQPGENFWTISKYYYSSGRFYKALALLLSFRLRRLTYRVHGTEEEAEKADELDDNLLDTVFLAGARFDRMIKRLS